MNIYYIYKNYELGTIGITRCNYCVFPKIQSRFSAFMLVINPAVVHDDMYLYYTYRPRSTVSCMWPPAAYCRQPEWPASGLATASPPWTSWCFRTRTRPRVCRTRRRRRPVRRACAGRNHFRNAYKKKSLQLPSAARGMNVERKCNMPIPRLAVICIK